MGSIATLSSVIYDIYYSKRGLIMQEVLTAVTYLVVWLICQRVLEIESGLANLLISLSAAIGVYVFMAVREYRAKKKQGLSDE
jgi:uncharacterized membrane-anchored protein